MRSEANEVRRNDMLSGYRGIGGGSQGTRVNAFFKSKGCQPILSHTNVLDASLRLETAHYTEQCPASVLHY